MPTSQRRKKKHREVGPLPKVASWEEAGLGVECRQSGSGMLYGLPAVLALPTL